MNNKTAVVTGASSGIGREISLLLALNGAKVFAVARRKDRLGELAKICKNIIPVELDITQDLSPLLDKIGSFPIDILVNSAGGAFGKDSLHEAPLDKIQKMIDINLTALVRITQAFLPGMIQRGSGDVVNIGSIAAFEYYAGGAVYCGVKAAVNAITKSLRHEVLGKNIRVIGIHPGLVNTEYSLVRFDGDRAKADAVYAGMTPLSGRDVAESILWALSCPRHVNVESLVLMPTEQASVWGVSRDNH